MNKALIIGRLGKDPELKHIPSGEPVCTFSVATSKKYKDKEGNAKESTEWHRIVTWLKLAENCAKYTKKGSLVSVEGELRTRSWNDKAGVKHYTTEIIAKEVLFLDSKEKQEPAQEQPAGDNSDLPF